MNQYSNSTQFLVIGDSHLKYSHSYFAQSSNNIIVKAIRGLKWVDYFDENLSVSSLLLSTEMQSIIISTKAVLFLVAINSIRIRTANKVINEIKNIILRLKRTFPHLNYVGGITISLCFPCFYSTKVSTIGSLVFNINLFNQKLKHLSREIDFEIVDFHITRHDLKADQMHLRWDSYRQLFRSIIIYFENLFPR